MTRYIRFLNEIGAQDLALVGGKGANLGEMTRAGLPVPPGFCLTADAYRDFIAAAGLAALLALASAVVTEVGGILSHGVIVAREYGIPAVMGVRGITAALSTGQVVQVDGNRGWVQVVMPPNFTPTA